MFKRKIMITALFFTLLTGMCVAMAVYMKTALNNVSTSVEVAVVEGDASYLDNIQLEFGYTDNGYIFANEGAYEIYDMTQSVEFDGGSAAVLTNIKEGEFEKVIDLNFIDLGYKIDGELWQPYYTYSPKGVRVLSGDRVSLNLCLGYNDTPYGEYDICIEDYVTFSPDSELVFYDNNGDGYNASFDMISQNEIGLEHSFYTYRCKMNDAEYVYLGNPIFYELYGEISKTVSNNFSVSMDYPGEEQLGDFLANLPDKDAAEQLGKMEFSEFKHSFKGGIYRVEDNGTTWVFPFDELAENMKVMGLDCCEEEKSLIIYGIKDDDAVAYIYYTDSDRCKEVVLYENCGEQDEYDEYDGMYIMIDDSVATFLVDGLGESNDHITAVRLGEEPQIIYDYDLLDFDEDDLHKMIYWYNSGTTSTRIDGDIAYICNLEVNYDYSSDQRNMLSTDIYVLDKGELVFQGCINLRTGNSFETVLLGNGDDEYDETGEWVNSIYDESQEITDYSLGTNECEFYMTNAWLDISLKK